MALFTHCAIFSPRAFSPRVRNSAYNSGSAKSSPTGLGGVTHSWLKRCSGSRAIASWMLAMASSSKSPSLVQLGSAGTRALNPPSSLGPEPLWPSSSSLQQRKSHSDSPLCHDMPRPAGMPHNRVDISSMQSAISGEVKVTSRGSQTKRAPPCPLQQYPGRRLRLGPPRVFAYRRRYAWRSR